MSRCSSSGLLENLVFDFCYSTIWKINNMKSTAEMEGVWLIPANKLRNLYDQNFKKGPVSIVL